MHVAWEHDHTYFDVVTCDGRHGAQQRLAQVELLEPAGRMGHASGSLRRIPQHCLREDEAQVQPQLNEEG